MCHFYHEKENLILINKNTIWLFRDGKERGWTWFCRFIMKTSLFFEFVIEKNYSSVLWWKIQNDPVAFYSFSQRKERQRNAFPLFCDRNDHNFAVLWWKRTHFGFKVIGRVIREHRTAVLLQKKTRISRLFCSMVAGDIVLLFRDIKRSGLTVSWKRR